MAATFDPGSAPARVRERTGRRDELAAFLRNRRERIPPESVGLSVVGWRRTPGLRREEVARLAGVGVSWYTWLEQGRQINVSTQVLEAVARALGLGPGERAHLFTLAELPDQAVPDEQVEVPQPVLDLLEHVSPYPALVQSGRFDILAHNAAYGRLMGDLDQLPRDQRNCMWLAFTDPAWREIFPDWEAVAERIVAQYRALMAEHVREPEWRRQVQRLRAVSPEFDRMWSRHEVTALRSTHKRFRNPLGGVLDFDVIHAWLQPHTGCRMLTYVPADARTRDQLNALADAAVR
jgi:transcriptional regulator with XRE-family HTH domain